MKQKWLCAAAVSALALLFAGCAKKVETSTPAAAPTPPPATATALQTPPTTTAAPQATAAATPTPATEKPVKKSTSAKPAAIPGLVIKELTLGHGAAAAAGDTVTVNYTGRLIDGTKFDSSLDRHQPFTFHLGAGEVIPGWDKGVVGMKVGGKRKLTISPDLGYGANGAGDKIPPNATLVFEIELLSVQ